MADQRKDISLQVINQNDNQGNPAVQTEQEKQREFLMWLRIEQMETA